MKPIGVAPALAIYQSLKTAGEELQHHDAGLEFGSVMYVSMLSYT